MSVGAVLTYRAGETVKFQGSDALILEAGPAEAGGQSLKISRYDGKLISYIGSMHSELAVRA